MQASHGSRLSAAGAPEMKKPGECRAPGCRVWRLVARTLAVEAVAAVDGLRAARAERNLGLAAAVRAGRAEHLARCAVIAAATRVAAAARIAATARVAAVASATPGRLADGAAGSASTRLAELAVCEELLFACGEREVLAAVCTVQRLVGHG